MNVGKWVYFCPTSSTTTTSRCWIKLWMGVRRLVGKGQHHQSFTCTKHHIQHQRFFCLFLRLLCAMISRVFCAIRLPTCAVGADALLHMATIRVVDKLTQTGLPILGLILRLGEVVLRSKEESDGTMCAASDPSDARAAPVALWTPTECESSPVGIPCRHTLHVRVGAHRSSIHGGHAVHQCLKSHVLFWHSTSAEMPLGVQGTVETREPTRWIGRLRGTCRDGSRLRTVASLDSVTQHVSQLAVQFGRLCVRIGARVRGLRFPFAAVCTTPCS